MSVDIPKGKYVLAVSGGVDSMVLLDILAKQPGLELVVAHYDHGIRKSSAVDAEFVRQKTLERGLVFYLGRGQLGPTASEDTARQARYQFLNKIKVQTNSLAIITAHHQDDLIETAIINIVRGTGPAGLVAMLNNKQIIRPLLDFSKRQILQYAKTNKIDWVDDETNNQAKYLRNYIRKNVTGGLSQAKKNQILNSIYKIQELSLAIEDLTGQLTKDILVNQNTIKRSAFSGLPSEVGNELIHAWLKRLGVTDLDKKTIQRLALAIKTARPASSVDIRSGVTLEFTSKSAQIRTP